MTNETSTQKPVTIESLKTKRVSQDDLYEKQNEQKMTLQELARRREVFYIRDAKLLKTQYGENYLFTCVGQTLGEFVFWAHRDRPREYVYEVVKREKKRNIEAIGPFFVEQFEPRQKGMNGYCRITVYQD